jgi:hypothetical protein
MATEQAFTVMPVGRGMRNVMLTVKLTGLRRFQWKCWLAKHMIRAAAYTMGCGCTIAIEMGVRKEST